MFLYFKKFCSLESSFFLFHFPFNASDCYKNLYIQNHRMSIENVLKISLCVHLRDNNIFCPELCFFLVLFIRCEIIRDGMREYLTPMGPTPLHVNPIFEIGPVEPRFSEWLVFEGISVDESGRQHYLDASVAYKRAVLNAIDYLSKFGYSKEQVCGFT